MSRILVIDAERRNWARRVRLERTDSGLNIAVTRRFLLIVEKPHLREIIFKEFSSFPNAVYPHESGHDDMFYCIVGPSCRRPKRLVDSLLYKLRKNQVPSEEIEKLQVVTT